MIAFPSSVRVWLAVGRTDMRRYAAYDVMRSRLVDQLFERCLPGDAAQHNREV